MQKSHLFSSCFLLVANILIILCPNISFSQVGCTDPLANNFDASAIENDGSCEYSPTLSFLVPRTNLPISLREISGMVWINDELWVQADGGNSPSLYRIDTTQGNILKEVQITNAQNIDWEDLAADDTYIYIGDFGNNAGNRRDLKIYRVSRADILNTEQTQVLADSIEFYYEDQSSFEPSNQQTEFDCEAMIYFDGHIHLFTKQWTSKSTTHYRIPADPGSHQAQKLNTYDASFLITGASINPTKDEIMLLGYNTSLNDFNSYFLRLNDFQGDNFFSGNKRKISLGSLFSTGQVEAISYIDNQIGFVGSEEISNPPINIPARLYPFDSNQWLATSIVEAPEYSLTTWPIPVVEYMNLSSLVSGSYIIIDLQGRQLMKGRIPSNKSIQINLKELNSGIYTIMYYSRLGFTSKKFIKQ